jgi:hypothetical protein
VWVEPAALIRSAGPSVGSAALSVACFHRSSDLARPRQRRSRVCRGCGSVGCGRASRPPHSGALCTPPVHPHGAGHGQYGTVSAPPPRERVSRRANTSAPSGLQAGSWRRSSHVFPIGASDSGAAAEAMRMAGGCGSGTAWGPREGAASCGPDDSDDGAGFSLSRRFGHGGRLGRPAVTPSSRAAGDRERRFSVRTFHQDTIMHPGESDSDGPRRGPSPACRLPSLRTRIRVGPAVDPGLRSAAHAGRRRGFHRRHGKAHGMS